mmetsp:Transcript_28037/g.56810  ORF Transcript_28037/g.56810 Transcript_28037/m.56810 type:complete len:231 (+) Transcript_28037:29-721(+)
MSRIVVASAFFLTLVAASSCTHVLEYFDTPGRGEAIRIALHSAGVKFTDKRLGWEEWQGIKSSSSDWVYKNGLPVLTVDGTKFSQSIAQMRYAARKGKLYSDNLLEAMRIDEVMDIVQDILAKTPSPPDPEEKKKQREEYASGKMFNFMSRLNQLAEQSTTAWIAGTADMAIADLMTWQLLGMISSGNFDHVPADYHTQFAGLSRLEKAVSEHAVVTGYYASLPAAKQDL